MTVPKRVLVVCLAIALALTLGSAVAMAENIKVGIVLPLTGEQAKFRGITKRSFEMTGARAKITERGSAYVSRTHPPASEYPAAVVTFLQEVVKPKSAVILFENTLFGQTSSKEFEEDCQKLGINVLLKEGDTKGGIDIQPMLTRVKATNTDLVYMVSYVMDAALLMRQAKELDFNPKLFIGGGAGFTLPEFHKNAGDAAELVYSATLWVGTVPYPGAMDHFNKYT